MSNLRKIEWLLMLIMIAAFIHAADAAADARIDTQQTAYTVAIEQCGVHPCRVPEQYRPTEYANVSCTNYEVGSGVVTRPGNISTLNLTR